jgi:hypothetical protein
LPYHESSNNFLIFIILFTIYRLAKTIDPHMHLPVGKGLLSC